MSIQKKYWLYIIGFILLVFLAYQFAFSKTIDEIYKNKVLKENQELLSSIESNLFSIKQQDNYYSKLLNEHQLSVKDSYQNSLLQFLTSFSKEHNITIINFNDPHILSENNAVIESYPVELKGDYISIVNLLHQLESIKRFGKIISCEFEKKKNYRTRKTELFCKFYVSRVVQE